MTDQSLQQILVELSAAFGARDAGGLLTLFSEDRQVTYAGSENGERATGRRALAGLFTELLARDQTYTFDFPHPSWLDIGHAVGVLADGTGTATSRDGTVETFPYRLCGVLVASGTG